jgi:hypothetical protein
MAALCRAAADNIEAHPARDRILSWQEPRSPESEARWIALVRQAHGE